MDHFSYVNQDRFKQRYIISTDDWCEGCPIFLYAGGEGDILPIANNTGFLWEHSKQFNAMVLFVEHRYYGQSIPYGKPTRVDIYFSNRCNSNQISPEFDTIGLFDNRTSFGRFGHFASSH